MHIGILTDFFSVDPAYSLLRVVETQIAMLKWSDERFYVIVDEAFPENPGGVWKGVEIHRIPGVPRSNVVRIDETWEQDIEELHGTLLDIFLKTKTDVVITHDLIYQPALVKHHIAARRVAKKLLGIKWLHWVHSATPVYQIAPEHRELAELREPFPFSFKIVFPNEYDCARVAHNYGIDESRVLYVPHATNITEFLDMHPVTARMCWETDILMSDYIGCYPARLDRGKQVEIVIEVFGYIKDMGYNVTLVIADFHSTGGDKVAYREQLKAIAKEHNLKVGNDLIFMHDYDPSTRVSSPRQVIRDLFAISDLFILPSRSETYSLVAQEAALMGNALVLNFDFPPIRSVYQGDALYFKFSSNIDALTGMDGETNTSYSDRASYMRMVAKRAIAYMDHPVLRQRRRIRKTRNPIAVYRDYLQPILYNA